MDGSDHPAGVALDPQAIDRLMPMHLCLAPDGTITGCGPTLRKLGGDGLAGRPFFDLFEVRRPGGIAGMADLSRRAGQRLYLALKGQGAAGLRGLAVPLAGGRGLILNLSFGVALLDAVRAFQLTDSDFAPTDLAVELLYLVEAKSAVMEELRQLNLRLQDATLAAEQRALTDTLTGLRNRRALDEALAEAIARRGPFALMHMDLDFFKAVNDTLGHAAGDHVLRTVARVLTAEMRQGDTVARVGGDEFVLLLPGPATPPQLRAVADRIIGGLTEPIAFEGRPCRISASIGITVATGAGRPDAATLQAEADAALYASKRAGRGRATMFGA